MQLLTIFLLGAAILAGALVLNYLASVVGLPSWYDFLKSPGNTTPLSYVWLFVLYPFGLGLTAYIAAKFINL